ncbi:30S ribosomal protein S18 [Patescibacteria group bacterium]|nr:30S ribosomal protein S18 [Patescibacteria group bacterium]MBU4353221.1 30S ribosomal protein S18 [Patescibacteria group bacterium]MBU4477117.1 30S ribosomal protein S18 [Patescibacteria group bacterium]MCG2698954.1 30S ribosomal protein S18 [Candidatus Parcubacteria bacterium]
MRQCYFCTNNIKEVDYKESELLKKFLNFQSKILPREETNVCAKHQRKLARAVKRCRFLGLIPFVSR